MKSKRKKVTRHFVGIVFALLLFVGPLSVVKADGYESGNFSFTYSSTNPITANGSYYTEPDYVTRESSQYYKTVIEINWTKVVTGRFYLMLLDMPINSVSGWEMPIYANCQGVQLTDVWQVPNTSRAVYMEFTVYGVDYARIEVLTLYSSNLTPPGVVGFAEPDSSHTIFFYQYGSDSSAANTAAIYSYLINEFDQGFQVLLDSNVSVPVSMYAAWFWCSKRDPDFPQYYSGLPYAQYNSSYHNSTYDQAYSFRLSEGAKYVFVFYTDTAISASDISVYYPSNSNGTVTVSLGRINEIAARFYLQEIIFTNNYAGFTNFEPEFNKTFKLFPLYFGSSVSIPDDVLNQLGQDYDNTYTRLLQAIASGVASSSQTVVNTTTNITNYETNFNTINNVETNIMANFGTTSSSVSQAVSNSGVVDPLDQNASNAKFWLEGNFTRLTGINFFKIPIYLILTLFVVAALLG